MSEDENKLADYFSDIHTLAYELSEAAAVVSNHLRGVDDDGDSAFYDEQEQDLASDRYIETKDDLIGALEDSDGQPEWVSLTERLILWSRSPLRYFRQPRPQKKPEARQRAKNAPSKVPRHGMEEE